MRPARIILLLVALLAGGLAAFLATRGGGPEPATQVTQVVASPETKILTAKVAIGVAERLTPDNVEWIPWPESALRPDYVTIAAMPEAATELAGSVARFEFFPGEPIRDVKLVKANQGYLSAVLEQGMRGISIPVASASASGGFIVPNDRVDVILSQDTPGGQMSETILNNVKVLAIGQRLGEVGTTGSAADPENPRAEIFTDGTIATLELTPAQGETLINASSIGSLSLALRSMADFNESPDTLQSTNQAIRVIKFGTESNVMSGNLGSGPAPAAVPATIDPAAYTVPAVATPSNIVPPNAGVID